MMRFLEDLAARRRFGMKPGLDTIRTLSAALGDPQKRVKAIHIAGTNGKGAVAAFLDAALPHGLRYTSPHLVRLNERFFLDGAPVDDQTLDRLAAEVSAVIARQATTDACEPTFFEALTAVAFLLAAEARVDYAILETGLGGRLDATNICAPVLTIITKIGLDHCDWLGDTVEKIAAEKAGIIKRGVPVVLGRNEPSVRAVIAARAEAVGAPFYYAPDLVCDDELPADLGLKGAFNRENALTALAALKVLRVPSDCVRRFRRVVWPGRFQQVGSFLVDGAHNPPAARALVAALEPNSAPLDLVFAACGDKDVDEVLAILRPVVARGFAVKTQNPRALEPEALAAKMTAAGIPSVPCRTLSDALAAANGSTQAIGPVTCLVCGSLFLAGEALVQLGAYPWPTGRFDPSEALKATR